MGHRFFWAVIVIVLSIHVVAAQDTLIRLVDISYVDNGDDLQRLDIYLPSETRESYPTIFMVHGGGFYAGDKLELEAVALRYAAMGYAVITPNYRLAPQVTFPQAHGDVFCALAWMFAHSTEYQLDLSQLVLFGESAGANAVAYLGAVDDTSAYMQDCAYDFPEDSHFQAVIALYMPVDLLSCACSMARRMASFYTGISYFEWDNPESIALHQANSVTTWLDEDDPPFYLIHGDKDFLVPVSESEFFVEAYQAVGGQVELVILEGANHGFMTAYPSPYLEESYRLIDDWLSGMAYN